MAAAKELRKSIRKAISESIKSEKSNIGTSRGLACQLDKIFADFAAGNSISDSVECGNKDDDESITPLIFACDQKCSGALNYLLDQLKAASSTVAINNATPSLEKIMDAWGYPNDECSSGNRAAHHIMAVGFNEGIDLMFNIQGFLEEEGGHHFRRYIHLLTPTNKNGDTPIMMACAFGHVSTVQCFVERTIQATLIDALATVGRISRDVIDDGLVIALEILRDCLSTKNKEGRTAFNLACGHGRVDIVNFLIKQVHLSLDSSNDSIRISLIRAIEEGDTPDDGESHLTMPPLTELSHSDLDFCEKTVNKIVAGKENIRATKHGGMVEEFEFQYEHACECLSMVQREMERIADKAADELCSELLTDRGEPETHGVVDDEAKKKKRKKKKKKKCKNTDQQSVLEKLGSTPINGHVTAEPFRATEDAITTEHPEAVVNLADLCPNDGNNSPISESSDFVLPSMPSAKCLRKSISNVIASQELANTKMDISSRLDKIFLSFMEGKYDNIEDDDDDDDQHPTPLMVACNKKSSEALTYLLNQLENDTSALMSKKHLVEAWGHPHETSYCGNQASHDAMAVGFSEGIELLEKIWESFEDDPVGCLKTFSLPKAKIDTRSMLAFARVERYLDLFAPNENGDTPIMMACVFGCCSTIQYFVERIIQYDLMINPSSPSDVKDRVLNIWNIMLKDFIGLANCDELTAFNLACGHGHIDVVKLLVEQVHVRIDSSKYPYQVNLLRSEEKYNGQHERSDSCHIHLIQMSPLAQLSYSDLEFCETTLDKIVDAVAALSSSMKKKNREEREKEYELQYERTRECYYIVGNELTRIANETAKELWFESSSVQVKSHGKAKKVRKRQSKKSRIPTLPVLNTPTKKAGIAGEAEKSKLGTQCVSLSSSSSSTASLASQKGSDQSLVLLNETPVNFIKSTCAASIRQDARDKPTVIETPAVADKSGENMECKPLPKQTLGVVDSFEIKGGDKVDCAIVASSSRKRTDNEASPLDDEAPFTRNEPVFFMKPKPLYRILQSTSLSASKADEDIAALMESLCLEPSMLLYSPHEMAIEMSPCQLDVLEDILKHQLQATKTAQKIHARLLNK